MAVRRQQVTGWGVLILIVILYISLLPVDYNFDGTVFSQNLRYALVTGDLKNVIQPHHLLYLPTAFVSYRLLESLFSYRVLEYFHLQMLSLIFGILLLHRLYRMIHRLCDDHRLALLSTMTAASTAGIWYFSVSAEVHIPALFFSLCAVGRLFTAPESSRNVALAALYLVAAAGFHLAHLLMVPVAMLALFHHPRRWRALGVFVLVFMVCMMIPLILYAGTTGADPINRFADQLFGEDVYAGYVIPYWSGPSLKTLGTSLQSVTATLLYPRGPAAAGLGYLLALMLIILVWRQRRRLEKSRRRLLWGWSAAYLVFFTLWDSGNMEFKLPVMLAGLLCLFLVLPSGGKQDLRDGFLLIFAGFLLLGNYLLFIRPMNSLEANRPYQLAERVSDKTDERAIIVVAGVGSEVSIYNKIYLPYFARRQVWILDWMLGRGSDLSAIRQAIAGEKNRGRAMYLFSELLESEAVRSQLMRTHDPKKSEWEAFLLECGSAPRIPLDDSCYLAEL